MGVVKEKEKDRLRAESRIGELAWRRDSLFSVWGKNGRQGTIV